HRSRRRCQQQRRPFDTVRVCRLPHDALRGAPHARCRAANGGGVRAHHRRGHRPPRTLLAAGVRARREVWGPLGPASVPGARDAADVEVHPLGHRAQGDSRCADGDAGCAVGRGRPTSLLGGRVRAQGLPAGGPDSGQQRRGGRPPAFRLGCG
ncbi:hypothetical protein EMIHUDRAFT_445643, partial [Emiliania huxleyi CCMP1516]|uniref:Uncharacterized protein n=2 Tax=Emiliania huxleyi TaxID=2903 RepID=A0A0D3IV65_EMIH1